METPEAIQIIRTYWPDTQNIMWGEALEIICTKALESANMYDTLGVLRMMVKTESNTAALEVIDGMISRLKPKG